MCVCIELGKKQIDYAFIPTNLFRDQLTLQGKM